MPGPAWVWNLWRECSGVSQELKLGGGGGVSPDRVGAGRPRGWQGRGWTGQRLGVGAARLSEHSTSTHLDPPGLPCFTSVPTIPGPLLGPMALQQESQGQLAESRRGALQGPGVWGGRLPWASQPGPSEGATLPPTQPGTESSRPLFFSPSVIKYSCQQSRPSLGRLPVSSFCFAQAFKEQDAFPSL